MKHYTFADSDTFTTAILIKDRHFKKDKLEEFYVNPLHKQGVPLENIIAFDLESYNNKISAKQAKDYLQKLLPALVKLGVTTLYVADATYFKVLTSSKKAEPHTGYILPCTIKGFTHLSITYGISYGVLLHNANHVHKLDLSIQSLASHLTGSLVTLGEDVLIDPKYYAKDDYDAIGLALDRLATHSIITCDIETYGLRLDDGGIGTIAFSWSKHEGIAINIRDTKDETNPKLLNMLKKFFERYTGTVIYHNASFDIKHIIYNCFMTRPLDHIGLLHGLHTMTKSIHDTKIITYLATNSVAGNELGLKTLAHPFLGNYGVEVEDISKISRQDLLEYNLKDCVGTYYVYEEYYPKMLQDDQRDIYENIMLPSLKLIIQMELVGMPISMPKVSEAKAKLVSMQQENLAILTASPLYTHAELLMRQRLLTSINLTLKVKQHGFEKVENAPFNLNSNKHLQILIYEVMQLPVLNTTPSGDAAVGAKSLKKLISHTDDANKIDVLKALIGLNKVEKILTTFIPAFEKAQLKEDGHHYLHGNFNIGGTLSGRLSSSKINLQNLN